MIANYLLIKCKPIFQQIILVKNNPELAKLDVELKRTVSDNPMMNSPG